MSFNHVLLPKINYVLMFFCLKNNMFNMLLCLYTMFFCQNLVIWQKCVSLYRRRTYNPYVRKHKIIWPHGARPALFPQHPADVGLAETEVAVAGRSSLSAPRPAAPPYVPPSRSKHYLPTIRAALSCPFSPISALWILGYLKIDFQLTKPAF